ncbi:unnamed protein product [Trichobilharzia regenti]|nr:unnamed protein product [Trichobilharzia regenti]
MSGTGNYSHPFTERYLRRTVDEQLRDLTLESERNRTRTGRDPQNSNFDRNSISILHRRGRFDSRRAQDSVTQSSSELPQNSNEFLNSGGIAEAESSDNFLVDEEEAEATVATEEELDGTE